MGQSSSLLGGYGKGEEGADIKRTSLSSYDKKSQDKRLYFAVTGKSLPDGQFQRASEISTIEALLAMGCRPTYTNSNGHTVIHEAASRGRSETLKLLLEKYPNEIDQKSRKFFIYFHYNKTHYHTPLSVAIMNRQEEIVKLLILKGAKDAFYHLVRAGADSKMYRFVFELITSEFGESELGEIIRSGNRKMNGAMTDAVPSDIQQIVEHHL